MRFVLVISELEKTSIAYRLGEHQSIRLLMGGCKVGLSAELILLLLEHDPLSK